MNKIKKWLINYLLEKLTGVKRKTITPYNVESENGILSFEIQTPNYAKYDINQIFCISKIVSNGYDDYNYITFQQIIQP